MLGKWKCKKCGGLVLADIEDEYLDRTYVDVDKNSNIIGNNKYNDIFYECQSCGVTSKKIKTIANYVELKKCKLEDYKEKYVFVRTDIDCYELIPKNKVLHYIKKNHYIELYGVKHHTEVEDPYIIIEKGYTVDYDMRIKGV